MLIQSYSPPLLLFPKIIILSLMIVGNLCGTQPYTIVGTGQTGCYRASGEIAPPQPGQPFYGQDAQYPGLASHYTQTMVTVL